MTRSLSSSHLDQTYDDDYYWYLDDPEFHKHILTRLAALVNNFGPRVLDCGCGEGQLAKHIRKGVEYVGLEGSEVALQRAAKLYPQFDFVQGRIEYTRIESKFNCIVFGGVLECLIAHESGTDWKSEKFRK